MPVQLAERVKRVKPSPTVALTGRVARLKAEGHDIIGLGVGEPDFDTPAHIADAGVDAIRNGFTRYTAVEGIPELKDAIIAKFKRDNGITYTRPQILVSTGAKQTIYNLFMAVIDPGDEVVIPAPYWVSYPDMALLADGVPGDALRPAPTRATRSRPRSSRPPSRRRPGCSCSTARATRPAPPTRARNWRRSARCCAITRA